MADVNTIKSEIVSYTVESNVIEVEFDNYIMEVNKVDLESMEINKDTLSKIIYEKYL